MSMVRRHLMQNRVANELWFRPQTGRCPIAGISLYSRRFRDPDM
jgi:hypothetical protein